ncbi:protein-methionine-sulfoxide reductase catalytic subunit MsrP [Paracoccus sp. S-4012]|uniref:protein-methionine-sulfoxide reductase catalytic subunit MsrP n=1 Tax=Paracoccus sp. S-4012 TaxID=2665648 RepID=UPI0012B0A6B9|nr:protein-methionine-sulfoxide reductase catalytic subunit MsrP [Paracoccus sp. S-4012]MRX49897.1 protein-methionine-sulfoxide reductase catalytic subunit MsrP [Paracoccus sp. S-4012]
MRIPWSEVTPPALRLRRRAFLGAGAAALLARPAFALTGQPSPFSTDETLTPLEDITSYNNFVEFGSSKDAPSRLAGRMTTDPWSVAIDGLVERPGSYGVEDLAPESAVEERIYRLRCVEGWSMVIPWLGVPLGPVLERAGPTSAAKYVAFETLWRPEEMPGAASVYGFPYQEGLRLDEAMNPLAILATGIHDQPLPNQNGAPIRLVVPWKYGFKSIKSVVRITLTDTEPATTWNLLQPQEYGFYANVNPEVDHPRWSQATERRIGEGLFGGRRPTLPFNGYADQVAHLYAGQDLRQDY